MEKAIVGLCKVRLGRLVLDPKRYKRNGFNKFQMAVN